MRRRVRLARSAALAAPAGSLARLGFLSDPSQARAAMQTEMLGATTAATDTFPINGTDFIEFYVGNAKQSSLYYRTAFGYRLTAYRGPETGTRDRASYLLEQDKVRLVLTTPLRPDHPIAEHVRVHGDGVKDIALWVDDVREAYR